MSKELVKAAQLDAAIAIATAGGYQLSDSFPRWHAPNIPTLRGALELAEAAGVVIERKQVEAIRRNRQTETRVIVWVSGSVVASAALSRDPLFGEIVATGLAFRNAVQRLCCDGPRVWRGQPDE